MKFVVTGATGFLAAEFIKLVLQEGHEVYAVCRNVEKARSLFPGAQGLTYIRAVMDEYACLDQQIAQADVFVSLAWDTLTPDQRDSQDLQQGNIDNTLAAMKAARRMGCGLFVEAGSQAEYGGVDGLITEDTPCHPVIEYGRAKLRLKSLCTDLAGEIGIKYLHTRIFSVFGLRDHPYTLINTCLQNFMQSVPVDLSPCTQTWNFLYVKDAVKQMYLLCDYALHRADYQAEVYNLASDDTRVLKSYLEEMKAVMASGSVLNFGAVTPQRIVSLNPSIEKLKQAIGFVSDYTFAKAISEMVQNYEVWQR